jgi:uncharacterized protein YbbC (DUF1343 family)/CubicO group peptidase (beta-lactamase class C family)
MINILMYINDANFIELSKAICSYTAHADAGQMKIGRWRLFTLILLLWFLFELPFATAVLAGESVYSPSLLQEKQLEPIGEIIEKAINSNKIPGAVVLIGNQDRVIYRKAFGHRAILPRKLPMTVDTIFDISSLTKVIATTTALLQLVEKGKLSLEDPVANYWPEFKANGKEDITVRELLTHYSGLRPDLTLKKKWSGYNTALKKVIAERPMSPPGTRFIYSDINFIILGELVHRISGQTLDVYCADHIFKPLGMKDTVFKPSPALYNRIAPTQYKHHSKKMLLGKVYDPIAYRMGGVAGHAGLFSTADDLSIFAQMLLNSGKIKNAKILSPLMVEKMTTPQSPPNKIRLRGLGWDIDSPFTSNRGDLFPVGSYGHTGFTGTSIWIDPVTRTYIIILTNQVHSYGRDEVKHLRAEISTIVAAALGPVSSEQVLASRRSLTGYYEIMKSYRVQGVRNGSVQTGIDVLEKEKFAVLKGLRIGLITNHSGLDSSGQYTLDILYKAPGVKLVAIFSPEHGLFGNADEADSIRSYREPKTGLPVYSLYGNIDRPTDRMLKGLDALVFDIQDAGVRFYTYITTMGYAMEAAARNKIAFYILDRPNPITSSIVQGPILDKDLKSFAGYFPLPVRHGMTVGELARMFNNENKIGANLHVIKMRGYERTDWYDETGLLWVKPSPNLHTLTEAILYPGVAMVEGANVSVGRGTDTPFEILGAPWINAKELAIYLNNRKIQGVRFMPVDFTPTSSRFGNQVCHGIQIVLIDRQSLNPAVLGVELASALYKLYPKDFLLDKTLDLIGSRWILQAIKDGQDPSSIILNWQDQLEQFCNLRSKYLLY